MEKKSEYQRFFDELSQKDSTGRVLRDMYEFLCNYKKIKTQYEMVPNCALFFLLYGMLEDVEKDFKSFCVYYDIGEYDINQIIEEL